VRDGHRLSCPINLAEASLIEEVKDNKDGVCYVTLFCPCDRFPSSTRLLFWSRHTSSVPVHGIPAQAPAITAWLPQDLFVSTTIEMSLPHELLDEIFGYIPLDDWKSLRAFSLVAKSWVSPARRRLFSSVVITEENFLSWKDRISPTDTILLEHVRSLRYFAAIRSPCCVPFPITDFFIYLPSFHHLQHLSLCSMRIKSEISEQLGAFSSFRHTLQSLTFHAATLTWFAFIKIVDYFPNVRDLVVSRPLWEIHDRQAIPLSRPLRGKLSIDLPKCRGLPAFSGRLSGLKVECDELVIIGGFNPGPPTSHYQHVVDTCGKSLKRLRLSSSACTLQSIRDNAER